MLSRVRLALIYNMSNEEQEQIQGFPVRRRSVAPLSAPLEDAPLHEGNGASRPLRPAETHRPAGACGVQSFNAPSSLVVLVLVKGLAPSLPSNWSAIFGDDPSSMYQNTSQPRECRESFSDDPVLARPVFCIFTHFRRILQEHVGV